MGHINPYQRILLSAEYLFDIKSFSEFETLYLGVMIKYIRPFEKKVSYFWGYKNHILSDSALRAPLV